MRFFSCGSYVRFSVFSFFVARKLVPVSEKVSILFNNELGSNALIAHGLQIWPLVSGKVDYGPAQATRGQRNAAMGKAKPTKHTAAELKKKEADATVIRKLFGVRLMGFLEEEMRSDPFPPESYKRE